MRRLYYLGVWKWGSTVCPSGVKQKRKLASKASQGSPGEENKIGEPVDFVLTLPVHDTQAFQ